MQINENDCRTVLARKKTADLRSGTKNSRKNCSVGRSKGASFFFCFSASTFGRRKREKKRLDMGPKEQNVTH